MKRSDQEVEVMLCPKNAGFGTTSRQDDDCRSTDLAPHQHGAEDDLEAVEEVVSYDDDCGAPRGPALAGTDGFNAGRGSWTEDRV